MIDLNDSNEILQNCMTYAYFFDDEHKPTGHPYILKVNKFEMLINRKELFARKFDLSVDGKILDLIDNYIKEKQE